jgi:hypothetical protein
LERPLNFSVRAHDQPRHPSFLLRDTRRLRHNGKVHFDVDGVCRWSFFFVDPSRSKLEPLVGHLQQLGYEVKGFLEPDSSNDRPVYFLRLDRIECHTVDSLEARNGEFYQLASRFSRS